MPLAFGAVAAPAHEQLQEPRGGNGIAAIQLHQLLGQPAVAAAIGVVERLGTTAKTTQHRPQAIGGLGIKAGMLQQGFSPGDGIAKGGGSLKGKPGIQDHRPLQPAGLELLQGPLALGTIPGLQGPQALAGQGHRGASHRCGRGAAGAVHPSPCSNLTLSFSSDQPVPGQAQQLPFPHPRRPGQIRQGLAALHQGPQLRCQRLPQPLAPLQQGPPQGRRIGHQAPLKAGGLQFLGGGGL